MEKVKNRTPKQNNSLHLYLQLLSDELNDAGWDMRAVLKPEVEIPWTVTSAKEYLWRPIQEIMLQKKSTTKLTTKELQQVWEVVNRHVGEKCHIHVPFPSEEETENYLQSIKNYENQK